MPRLIISIDGVVIKEVDVTQERTTLGRRPYNDIVIDSLAISGEHAALYYSGGAVELEDLKSTNGTYINGKAVQRQQLTKGDTIEMGKYKIHFVDNPDTERNSADAPLQQANDAVQSAHNLKQQPALHAPFAPGALSTPSIPVPLGYAKPPVTAFIQVLSGSAAGYEVSLTKVVTTIGKPGIAVASITRRHHGFVLSHLQGPDKTVLNGTAIGSTPLPLSSNDLIELAGTQMRFIQ